MKKNTNPLKSLMCSLLLLCLLGISGRIEAHTFGQVRQNCYLEIQKEGLLMSLVMQLDSGVLAFTPDPDQSGIVDFTEWSALLGKIETKLRPKLKILINEEPIAPQFQPPGDLSFDPRGLNYGAKATFSYLIPLPENRLEETTIFIADESFSLAGPEDRLSFFIDALIQPLKVQTGEKFWHLSLTLPPGKNRESLGNTFLELEGQYPVVEETEESTLLDSLQKKEPSVLFIIGTLLTALLLGAAHALSPGHGKAMVGAFLVGTRGRIRDAFIIGGTVAFTHVASVLLLGLVILYFSEKVDMRLLQPWIGAASGCLIFLIGYWILVRQAITAGHNHHGHDHDHTTSQRGNNSLGSLLSMGIAGGMVPCPSAIVVLLAAVAIQKTGLGLLIILAFSLGLAAVLIVIAVLAVTASKVVDRFDSSQKWIKRLPLISALVVMVAGIGICIGSLINGNILIIQKSLLFFAG